MELNLRSLYVIKRIEYSSQLTRPRLLTTVSSPENASGFSLLELTVTVAIAIVLMAFSVPAFLQMVRSYQLAGSARSVADLIQRARYEAIKQNTKITCYFSLGSTPASAWVDVNRTGTYAAADPKVFYPALVSTLGGAVPSPSSMGFPAVTQVANSGSITFDSRGAVDYTGVVGGPTVWVLYFTLNGDSTSGAKAISIEPLGRTKVWSAPPGASVWQNP